MNNPAPRAGYRIRILYDFAPSGSEEPDQMGMNPERFNMGIWDSTMTPRATAATTAKMPGLGNNAPRANKKTTPPFPEALLPLTVGERDRVR